MKDPIKKLNEIDIQNEALFGGVFKKSKNEYFMKGEPGGFSYIKGPTQWNPVRLFSNNALWDIENNEVWENEHLKWLIEGTYEAQGIWLTKKGVEFAGIWYNGDFKGRKFFDYSESSSFLGGRFMGEKYNANNLGYKAPAQNFITGTYYDNKTGILGRNDIEEGVYDEVDLVSVPLNYYLVITNEENKKIGFKLLKRLDEVDSTFIFKIIPFEKNVLVAWENIRLLYENNKGIIKKGEPFNLKGIINIDIVKNINVLREYDYIPILKEKIDFSVDPKLNFDREFDLSFNTIAERDVFLKLKKDLLNGIFSSKLIKAKRLIELGDLTGYNGFSNLRNLFNNVEGDNFTEEAEQLLDYINKIYIDLIFNITGKGLRAKMSQILKWLKNFLNIDKYIYSKEEEPIAPTEPPEEPAGEELPKKIGKPL